MHGGTTRRHRFATVYRREEASIWASLAQHQARGLVARQRLAELEEPPGLGWPVAVGPGFGWPGVSREPQPLVGPIAGWLNHYTPGASTEWPAWPEMKAQIARSREPAPELLPPTWLTAALDTTEARGPF